MSEAMLLSTELSVKMDKIIEQLRKKLHPTCIILADISGQLLSNYVVDKSIDVIGLAALFASKIGATSAIALKIKEDTGFDTVMYEGKNQNVFLSKIKDSYLLAVIFTKSDQVGLVRLFARKACDNLAELIQEYEFQNKVENKINIGANFSTKLEQNLLDIFHTS